MTSRKLQPAQLNDTLIRLTTPRAAPAEADSPFRQSVLAVVDAADFGEELDIRSGGKQIASVHRQGNGSLVLTYGPHMESANSHVRSWTVAHELAHVVLGHLEGSNATSRVLTRVLAAGALASLLVPALAIYFSRDLGWMVLAVWSALSMLIVMAVIDAHSTHPHEVEADRWATALVGPLLDSDRDWLARHAGRPDRPRRPGQLSLAERAPKVLRTHPRWAERGLDESAAG